MLTLIEAKEHLYLDHSLDDTPLVEYIEASLAIVSGVLGFDPINTEREIPVALIKQAQRLLVADMYRDREATTTSKRFNKDGVTRLLSPYSILFIA